MLDFPDDFKHLPVAEERLVLHAMHHQLLERELCLRQTDPAEQSPTMLVFPSELRGERPPRPDDPACVVSFPVGGHLAEVWASLVVRLHHSQPFGRGELWRNAADFNAPGGGRVGLRLVVTPDGLGEVEVGCDGAMSVVEQALLVRYVQEHLRTRGLRTYRCPTCATPVLNREVAEKRLLRGDHDMACPLEESHRIRLRDELAQVLRGDDLAAAAERVAREIAGAMDSESRERVLVGEVMAVVANAGQLWREVTVSDKGIDGEIEFKDDEGRVTGKKLYLQLKSGDSHLRQRGRDGSRVFEIKNPRHADYWADQAFPMYLVVRDGDGVIEWMEIGAVLRRLRDSGGKWPVRSIEFVGERFDVMAVRRARQEVLRLPFA